MKKIPGLLFLKKKQSAKIKFPKVTSCSTRIFVGGTRGCKILKISKGNILFDPDLRGWDAGLPFRVSFLFKLLEDLAFCYMVGLMSGWW
jgi:hypothetical protein